MLVPERARRVLRVPLTPLIDVVFILLLFFMLSSSFARQQQIEFRAAAASAGAASDEARHLLLQRAGGVSVAGRVIDIESAAFAALLEVWGRQPGKVTVAAVHDVAVQELVGLLDRLRGAGVGEVDLAESVRP